MTRDAFLLGSHMPSWLETVDVPLFISHRRLKRYKRLPRAKTTWCLDSGGFSELSLYGKWVTTPEEYVAAVRRYRDEIGNLQWAAPMDMMVEPVMRERTGLTVREHQYLTVENVVLLRHMAPDLPIIPVLQGWELSDYMACIRMYDEAGIDLKRERIVGLGSVCRRQREQEIGEIVQALQGLGIHLHGFGIRRGGLEHYHKFLQSSDSMAWSFGGRYINPCPHSKRTPPPASCANCITHALNWRESVLSVLD